MKNSDDEKVVVRATVTINIYLEYILCTEEKQSLGLQKAELLLD